MGSVQTTLYQAAGEATPVEVKTQSRSGESSRTFDARHLDELEASFEEKPVEVKPDPAKSRDIVHVRVSNGSELTFPIDHRRNESAEGFMERAIDTIEKAALHNRGDV